MGAAAATWAVPLIASAVSAGATYYNARQQNKRADRIALQSLQANRQRQQKADEATKRLLADQAASTPKEERKGLLDGFLQQLQLSRKDAQSGLGLAGRASEAFSRDAAAASLGMDQAANSYADLASRLDAPYLQRRNEARRFSDALTELGVVGREQEGADRVTNLRMQGVRSNPWLEALAQVAGGVARGYNPRQKPLQPETAFAPSANSMLDPALGSAWGGANSLVWGSYGGLR